eukprot:gnl/TRDRNA2_/TRDRNA2_179816_c0_seq1.p1 gnl/TRDRNA2_/TRDRNA2_179816_c0~~gnl/TRDRNA2_/TRDRNA2_179816_c0_seq1.p1  ORF type:complete len:258 (-),score=45.24 gnl/TRDRNA2_/TRDRNA2_179816_c0_seq1:125-898(-)
MGKPKKGEYTFREKAFIGFNVFSCLLLIVSVVPAVPWRMSYLDSNMALHFSTDRFYSLFTVTDRFGQPVGWTKLAKQICMKHEQLMAPNPISAGLGALAGAVGAGAGIVGCEGWKACKDNVAARCMNYPTIAYGGMFAGILILIGGCCCAGAVGLIMMEANAGKKKKNKEQAMYNTAMAAIAGFVLPLLGLMVYYGATDSAFKAIKMTGYYPWPKASGGFFACGLACFINFFTAVGGYRRTMKKKDDEEKEGLADGE